MYVVGLDVEVFQCENCDNLYLEGRDLNINGVVVCIECAKNICEYIKDMEGVTTEYTMVDELISEYELDFPE